MSYKLILFTGAGISLESGIPTFQEQEGLRDKLTRDFANECPIEYKQTIQSMFDVCKNAKPNEAHNAIATLDCPVITMNIDGLHRKAGTSEKSLVELHGTLPTQEELDEENFVLEYDKVILYGDIAPKYQIAKRLVDNLKYNDSYFVIIGTSFYTGISQELLKKAKQKKAKIIIINDNAAERVPKIVKYLKDKMR